MNPATDLLPTNIDSIRVDKSNLRSFGTARVIPGVHMIFMSTEHDYEPGSAQYSWLEQELQSVDPTKTPFVIVYGHSPMYSSNSYHGLRLNFGRL
ncbi:MAG: hypothetical protein Ct9H90mP16_18940 [Candidatus Poseidoniales archaeon]|nr:MAG: hypothetical protein Ct9H90mP16_18940 [Candidatus Poseidoniales archaeon]